MRWTRETTVVTRFPSKSRLVMWQQQVYLNSQWRPRFRKLSYLNKINKAYFSWMTVRHPFERLLSAYRSQYRNTGEYRR